MLFPGAQSLHERQGRRDEKLLRRDIQRIVDQLHQVRLEMLHVLAHAIDHELDVAYVRLNGLDGDLADLEREFDLRPKPARRASNGMRRLGARGRSAAQTLPHTRILR